MKINRLAIALMVMLGGVALIISSYDYPALPGQKYGAGTMPFLIGMMGLLLGLALFVQSWAIRGGSLFQLIVPPTGRAGWGALASLLGVVAYILLADRLGFVPVAVILLFILMWLGRVAPVIALIISVLASLLIYVVFSRFLLVPLPIGPVETLIWHIIPR
ncbi:tripartite tricarboxylate transporter TctB family protein [Paracoccus seriniphilus]|uniref:tripartite tricarboxylate transporter TctB family protein n=1 Tax=Paracoccus seriniphilus TaxID=184748 RepID=UPI0035676208